MDTDGDYSLANLLAFASTVYASPKDFPGASLCLRVHSLYQNAG